MKEIRIGEQIWSAENLALTMDKDGKELVLGTDYFYPNNDENNVAACGLLYTWEAAMRVVPEGWHLPSAEEWDELINHVNNKAKALAATTGWRSSTTYCTAGNEKILNNDTGFSALPAGCYDMDCFYGFGFLACFWSSTEISTNYAWGRYLYSDCVQVNQYDYSKNYGYSVRCIKNTNDISSSIKYDNVNHPKHYTSHPSGVECIDITRHYDFCIGNAIKYLWRNGLKDEQGMSSIAKQIEDLNKAKWYIDDKIKQLLK